MKLLILSDLHLEFALFQPAETDHDVVILAGDIGVGPETIAEAAHLFAGKPIIFVPGNHEYYNTVLNECAEIMRNKAKGLGVHFLDNDEVVIDGVRFIGSTLWTDFRLFGDEPGRIRARQGQLEYYGFPNNPLWLAGNSIPGGDLGDFAPCCSGIPGTPSER